jgi:hypothetical protein
MGERSWKLGHIECIYPMYTSAQVERRPRVRLTDLAFSCKARTPRVRVLRPRVLDVHKLAEVEGPRTRPFIEAPTRALSAATPS